LSNFTNGCWPLACSGKIFRFLNKISLRICCRVWSGNALRVYRRRFKPKDRRQSPQSGKATCFISQQAEGI